MKIKEYNGIKRSEYPKWAGWKLLDFYNTLNLDLTKNLDETKIIKILEENFRLTRVLESII